MSCIYRDWLNDSDRSDIEKILASSHFFTDEEIAIALELVDDKLVQKKLSHYYFLVIEEEKNILGYTCYGRVPCTENSYDLYWIVVDNKKRNQNIGSHLLIETEKRIKELGGSKVYAETSCRSLYKSTHQFYLKNHYQLEARLKDFYAIGDDKAIFVKQL